ncbi:MAG: HNH endonuclease [Anaerolineales bacterium]|nr:HNH endonuclease [Anaerolineales bacterium]
MNISLNSPVLVLNANFEPINVCSIKRAIGLMVTDKASLVLNGRGEIRTVADVFPCPSVIRLSYMIKRPRPQVKLSKHEIFRRDNFTCMYCGKSPKHLTVDHVVPKRMGGGFTWENLATACSECNHQKGGRTIKEAGMKLIHQPYIPSASLDYIFGRYLNNYNEWSRYISGW